MVWSSCRERTGRVEFDPGLSGFEVGREGVRRFPAPLAISLIFEMIACRGASPDSTRDAVLLDCRFLGVGPENPSIPKPIFGRIYFQVGREIWIIHGIGGQVFVS